MITPGPEARESSRETHQTDGIQNGVFHQSYANVASVTWFLSGGQRPSGRVRVPPSSDKRHYNLIKSSAASPIWE